MVQRSRTVILAGADIHDTVWLRDQMDGATTIICADSGLRHAHVIGVTPDIIIGDFDSVDLAMLDAYRACSQIIDDNDQNKTDLMKALALCDDATPVHIYGAVGGRADHDFSTLLILMNMPDPNHIVIVSPHETRRIVNKNCVIHGDVGDYVGLFPLAPLGDFTVDGLLYPPDVLGGPYAFGWNGACNVMTAHTATISFSSGVMLVTHTARLNP